MSQSSSPPRTPRSNNNNVLVSNPWGTNIAPPIRSDSSNSNNNVPRRAKSVSLGKSVSSPRTNNTLTLRRTGANDYTPVNVPASAAASNNLPPPPPMIRQPSSTIEISTPIRPNQMLRSTGREHLPRGSITRIRNVATGAKLAQPVTVRRVPRPKKGGRRRARRTRRHRM